MTLIFFQRNTTGHACSADGTGTLVNRDASEEAGTSAVTESLGQAAGVLDNPRYAWTTDAIGSDNPDDWSGEWSAQIEATEANGNIALRCNWNRRNTSCTLIQEATQDQGDLTGTGFHQVSTTASLGTTSLSESDRVQMRVHVDNTHMMNVLPVALRFNLDDHTIGTPLPAEEGVPAGSGSIDSIGSLEGVGASDRFGSGEVNAIGGIEGTGSAPATSSSSEKAPNDFATIEPGNTLRTASEAASLVGTNTWEPRSANTTANNTTPDGLGDISHGWSGYTQQSIEELLDRVDGEYTGTTDQIIQWAALKYGFEVDLIRAMCVIESNWLQSAEGDNVAASTGNCVIGDPRDPCPTSFGITQVKHFTNEGTHPHSVESTAFNLDYAVAKIRANYEGWSYEGTQTEGDLWGAFGMHFSGEYSEPTYAAYVSDLQDAYNTKAWLGWADEGGTGDSDVSGSSAYTFGSSLTINYPGGTTEDDGLLAVIDTHFNRDITGVPSGWTLEAGPTTTGWGKFAVYSAVADGVATNATWTFSAVQHHLGAIIAVKGVDTSDLIDSVGTVATDSDADSIDIGAITPTEEGTLLLALYSGRYVVETVNIQGLTEPSGMTEVVDGSSQDTEDIILKVGVAYEDGIPANQSTGTRTPSYPDLLDWGGVLVALSLEAAESPNSGSGSVLGAGELSSTGFAPSSGAEWFVDNALGSNGDGTSWSTAWNSLANINWSSIDPGDTIYLSGGSTEKTYSEALVVGAAGTSGSPITITRGVDSGHDGSPIIDGGNSISWGIDNGRTSSGQDYIHVKHIHVRNFTSGCFGVRFTTGNVFDDCDLFAGSSGSAPRAFDVRSNTGMVIRNSRVTTPGDTPSQIDGIFSQDNTGYLYEGNHIDIANVDDTGHSDAYQSHLDGSGVIRNNTFISPTSGGHNKVVWMHAHLNGAVIDFYNNLCISRGGQHNVSYWREGSGSPHGTLRIWNNTIVSLAGGRALNLERVTNLEIRNNIIAITGSGTGAYSNLNDPSTASVTHNLVWAPSGTIARTAANGNRTWSQWTTTDGFNANGVNADPEFVDTDDFQLESFSPAIDAGTTIAAVETDILGVERPQGTAYDIGAYETLATSDLFTPGSNIAQAAVTATSAGSGAIASVGSLTAEGQATRSGSSSILGVGVITGEGSAPAVDTNSGSGSISGVGALSVEGQVATSGSGSIIGLGSIEAAGSTSHAGSGQVLGLGSIEGTGASAGGGTGTVSGVGALDGSGHTSMSGAGLTLATGVLDAQGAVQRSGAGDVAGVGSLTGTGFAPSVSGAGGAGSISATGDLQAEGLVQTSGSGVVTGNGELEATGEVSRLGSGGVTGVGAIQPSGSISLSGSGGISGVAVLLGVGKEPVEATLFLKPFVTTYPPEVFVTVVSDVATLSEIPNVDLVSEAPVADLQTNIPTLFVLTVIPSLNVVTIIEE